MKSNVCKEVLNVACFFSLVNQFEIMKNCCVLIVAVQYVVKIGVLYSGKSSDCVHLALPFITLSGCHVTSLPTNYDRKGKRGNYEAITSHNHT